jgi:hypothetical protein
MSINTNPVPHEGGNRAEKAVIVGAINLKKPSRFGLKNQSSDTLRSGLITASDDRHHAIIRRHWPVASMQQLFVGGGV